MDFTVSSAYVRVSGDMAGGIQFLTDEKGNRMAAVIIFKVHKALRKDIQDALVRAFGERKDHSTGKGESASDRQRKTVVSVLEMRHRREEDL